MKITPTKHENPTTRQERRAIAHYWLDKAVTMTNAKLSEVAFDKAVTLENQAFQLPA